MILRSVLSTFLVLCTLATEAQVKFITAPNGLLYNIFTANKGEKPKLDDVIKFQFIMKNSKDSELTNTYKTGQPLVMKLAKPAFKGDPMEGFAMMSIGDSAIFKISGDSLYKGTPNNPFKPGEMITFNVKMLDIKSYADYMKDLQKINAEAAQKEMATLEKFIKEKYPTAKKTESGMYYIITRPGTGPTPQKGQEVTAHYKGSLINGTVFDTDSGRGEAFKFPLGQHRVIAGWDEGFSYLNKGAKAVLIIPSKLGYGSQGVQSIPGNATLVFEVELVDIK
jgi:FKBP-type peptidyl-prolyl cis-trans isomerase FkpA